MQLLPNPPPPLRRWTVARCPSHPTIPGAAGAAGAAASRPAAARALAAASRPAAARRRRLAAQAAGTAAERVESGRCRRAAAALALGDVAKGDGAPVGDFARFRQAAELERAVVACLANHPAEAVADLVVRPREGHVRTRGQHHQRRPIGERERGEEAGRGLTDVAHVAGFERALIDDEHEHPADAGAVVRADHALQRRPAQVAARGRGEAVDEFGVDDPSRLSGNGDDEVAGRQAARRLSLPIDDADVDGDQLDTRPEGRRLARLGRRLRRLLWLRLWLLWRRRLLRRQHRHRGERESERPTANREPANREPATPHSSLSMDYLSARCGPLAR